MLIYDDLFRWEGWGGRLQLASGKCRLRLFDLKKGGRKNLAFLKQTIAVVTDVSGSKMSVRSCTSHVASKVSQQFDIDPARMLWVEYYPETTYGESGQFTIAERIDRVEFTWHDRKAIHPVWHPLTPPLRDIVKELIESAP